MNYTYSDILPLKIASEIVGYKPDTLRNKARRGIYPFDVIWKNSSGSWLLNIKKWNEW